MWPTKLLLVVYDKLNHRNMLGEYFKLQNTISFDLHSIKRYQENKLKAILEYAAKYVPFYRNILEKYDFKGFSQFRLYNKLPFLTKDIVRDNFDDLISEQFRNTNNIYYDYTGGSTGQPLKFAYDRNYKDIRWAMIYHNFSWTGYKLGDPHAFLYGSSLDYEKDISFRNKLQHLMMNSAIENAYHLNEEKMQYFLDNMIKRKVKYLIGYASALYSLAKFIHVNKIKIKELLKLRAVISTAEFLLEEYRQLVENVFECKVFDRYGCREVGNVAHECFMHKGLHINWQNIMVEILSGGKLYSSYDDFLGEGEIVITCFKNYGMPLIRYCTGDLGEFLNSKCKCSNHAPLLRIVGGRILDQFLTAKGDIISGLNFSGLAMNFKNIKQIQFIQNSYDDFTIKIVKSSNDIKNDLDLINNKFRECFGENVKVRYDFTEKIDKEKSGKYRYTKCLCPH